MNAASRHKMDNRLHQLRQEGPLIISGPCSAETELQLLETARQLALVPQVRILRAGIWKPRTKPGQFEGMGVVGLSWLRQAKEETGLSTTVEVATARHVEAALKHEVDILWIGARTTVNPFSVQELADALEGVNIPVFVKNPINPDVELWSGAIERLQKSVTVEPAMIHRGFSSYGQTTYRNPPMWQLPIEMKRRYPDLLMLCDPSHICGNRHMLKKVAQKSINLDFDGLMIESHIDPDNAWSDAKQQITPAQLAVMLDELIWRKKNDSDCESGLIQLRQEIDEVDDELLELISQRMKLADKIGVFKKEHNLAILQTERWNEILKRAHEKCDALGLNPQFIKLYCDAIHLESIRHQNNIMNSSSDT